MYLILSLISIIGLALFAIFMLCVQLEHLASRIRALELINRSAQHDTKGN
jgi:hypothetical protein